MEILIKDVDIPKCCNECRFKYAVKCRTYTGFHHQDTERAAKCPLVEVWDDCQKCIEALPSARPERSSEIQDILEYLDKVLHPVISPDHWNVYSELHDMISMLPSAQPEKRTDKRTETHACDSVNRQAAIDLVEGLESARLKGEIDLLYPKVVKGLIGLPSAQSEIIRCKDCKHYGRADKRRFYRGMDCLNKHIDTIVPDRDFCSKAERRTDEQTKD